MADISGALYEDRQGVFIAIEVTAGSREDLFPAGYNEWRKTIGCRVTAQAIEGRANKAILKLVARTLLVPVSSVSIVSGSVSSQKRVLVTDLRMQDVLKRLKTL